MRPAPPPGAPAAAAADGAGPRPRTRLRLRGQRDDAARDRRRHVHHQPIRPRRRARLEHRQGDLGVPGAVRRAVDARSRVLGRRREDPAADRLRLERRPPVLAPREDRRAERRVRRPRRDHPEHAGDSAGHAGQQRPELAADHVQEPDHHWRPHAGESAARSGRRRAGVGYPHRQAGVDVPLDSARRREVQRHLGGRQLEEPHRRQRLGLHHRRRPARHRLHAVRRAVGRSVRRRPRGRQPLQLEPGRRRRQHRQVPLALPDGPPRHLGRGHREPAGAD